MLTALACLWDLGFGLDDNKIVSILKMCKKEKPKHIQVKSSASSVARNQMFRSRRMWRQMQPSAARCGLGPSERMLQSLSDVNIFSSVLTAVIKKTTTLMNPKMDSDITQSQIQQKHVRTLQCNHYQHKHSHQLDIHTP